MLSNCVSGILRLVDRIGAVIRGQSRRRRVARGEGARATASRAASAYKRVISVAFGSPAGRVGEAEETVV